MDDCIFCQIVDGAAPASFVYRDDLVSAFLDIRPVTPGHLLVIPNEHVVHTHDLPDAIANAAFTVARRLARILRETDAVRADGVNLFAADGEAAGQEVFHAHLHVIPRHLQTMASRSPPARGAIHLQHARSSMPSPPLCGSGQWVNAESSA